MNHINVQYIGFIKHNFKFDVDLKLSLQNEYSAVYYQNLNKLIKKLRKFNFDIIVSSTNINSLKTAIHFCCKYNIKYIYVYNELLNNELIESELYEYHNKICNKSKINIIFKQKNYNINTICNDFINNNILIITDDNTYYNSGYIIYNNLLNEPLYNYNL
jgi:hypothetical protein